MRTNLPTLSVVCPVFEEEEVLPHFHRELCAVLTEVESEFAIEIVFVDDGSRDRTLPVLRSLAANDPRLRYLSFSRNFGHQAALTAGLEHARGAVVITLDADLQHPPELIPQLVERWRDGYDVVATVRAHDPRLGWLKRTTSRLFYRIMSWLSDTEMRPGAADFRLLSRKAVTALLQLRETHRCLRGLVEWLGFPTATVPYHPAPRRAGVTKYTLRRMVGLGLDAALSFSRLPLRLTLGLGVLSGGLGLLLGSSFLLLAWLGRLELGGGTAAILVALHLLGGAILIGLGLVGEYVGRIYEQVKGRPLYLLKESSDEPVSSPRLFEASGPRPEVGHADNSPVRADPGTSRASA